MRDPTGAGTASTTWRRAGSLLLQLHLVALAVDEEGMRAGPRRSRAGRQAPHERVHQLVEAVRKV